MPYEKKVQQCHARTKSNGSEFYIRGAARKYEEEGKTHDRQPHRKSQ